MNVLIFAKDLVSDLKWSKAAARGISKSSVIFFWLHVFHASVLVRKQSVVVLFT